ncbi:pyridoxal-phosphate-dependent aminotransferase family protein [Thermodesulfitimonas autotrophica]|uniref:pyridoxal-phosphate-dependent aminotransferase family protein n=1 Tax=Thermodesulfitimonas autotrophica TaxID=1894989 RepID=UPI002FDF63F1
MAKKMRLFIPGPTPVPPQVAEAMARPLIGHRTQEFADLYRRLEEKLRKVFGTQNEVYVLTCSGTGGMEAAVANIVNPGDRVLALVTGKFGERFAELAKIYGAAVDALEFGWGNPVDVALVEARLKSQKYKAVLATHNETSTTVVNDIRAIGELTRRYGALLLVDAVSSLGGIEIEADAWGVDILVTASQKALMVPPGLAMVSVSPRAWEAINEGRAPRYYLSLPAAKKSLTKFNTPYTPAVSLFVGLDVALDMILDEGLENVYVRHRIFAQATRAAVRALGLKLLAPDACASPVVTGVWAPEGMNADDLRRLLLKEYGVLLAGGQAQLKGRIFRISHMGYIDAVDLLGVLGVLEIGLQKFGYPVTLGAGVAAAQAVLAGGGQDV